MADLIEDIDSTLAKHIKTAEKENQRRMAIAAAKVAVTKLGLRHLPVVAAALQALEAGKVGPSDEQRALKTLAEDLDQVAFDASDRSEEGTGSYAEYEQAFMVARAASALMCAFEEDSYSAVSEAIYEAYHALDEDMAPIRKEVMVP